MTTQDDTVKAASVIVCPACGCLVSTSYWATHTGKCSEKPEDKPLKLSAGGNYWR